jgi:hypothetical protein
MPGYESKTLKHISKSKFFDTERFCAAILEETDYVPLNNNPNADVFGNMECRWLHNTGNAKAYLPYIQM